MSVEMMLCLFVWHFAGCCLFHGGHICVNDSFKVCEYILAVLFECPGVGSFASAAKTVNLWRNDGKEFHEMAVDIVGPTIAYKHCKSAPPKCLTERWGTCGAAYEQILAREPPQLRAVLFRLTTRLSERQAKRELQATPQRADQGLTELRDHEHDEHRIRHGKWGVDVRKAVLLQAWWASLRIAPRLHLLACEYH